jgi:lysophospholipase L1-like esterase
VSSRSAALLASCLVASACGGGTTDPSPVDPATADLTVVAFYDENGNGLLDLSEGVRLPGISVVAAGRNGQTAGSGEVRFDALPTGSQSVSVEPGSLPPFYAPPGPLSVTLPRSGPLNLPVTLPIGGNEPNTYLAFGDSVTEGFRSEDGRGWVGRLDEMLGAHFGEATVINDGLAATRTIDAAARIGASLGAYAPAYTLIFYGVNDYNEPDCRRNPPCYTIDSLRSVVRDVIAAESLPFIATITPSNTGFDFRTPPFRNQLVALQSELIRELAAEEGAVLVDLEEAFLAYGAPQDSGLLFDHVHPNDTGYQVIADTFFEAIVHGAVPAAASRPGRR